MATSLTSDECRSNDEAVDLFATRQGLLVLRQTQQICSMLSFTIPSGCYGLVTRSRADLDYMDEQGTLRAVWPAGLHFPYPPWVGVSYLITKRSTVFHLILEDCRTKDGISVDIDVVITFRIMGDDDLGEDSSLVRKFVYELTPSGLERQLRDAVRDIVRTSVRAIDHTDIYGMRSNVHEGLDSAGQEVVDSLPSSSSSSYTDDSTYDTNENKKSVVARIAKKAEITVDTLNERFNDLGVEILTVTIKNVLLPKKVQSQMEDEALSISVRAEELVRQEDATLSLCMEDEIKAIHQKSDDDLQQEDQAGLQRVTLQEVQLNDEKSQAMRAATEVREESILRIQKLVSRKAYEVQNVKDLTATGNTVIQMKAKLLSTEQVADAKKLKESCLADASLISAKAECEAVRILAEAEKRSWDKKKQDFVTSLKKINVCKKLADNKNLIFNSSSDESTSLLSVAESILEEDSWEPDSFSPTSVASEVALLKCINRAEKKKDVDDSDNIEEQRKNNHALGKEQVDLV